MKKENVLKMFMILGAVSMLLNYLKKVHPKETLEKSSVAEKKGETVRDKKESVENSKNKLSHPSNYEGEKKTVTTSPGKDIESLLNKKDVALLTQKWKQSLRDDLKLHITRRDPPFLTTEFQYQKVSVLGSYAKWEERDGEYFLEASSVPEFESIEGDFSRYEFESLKKELLETHDHLESVKETKVAWGVQSENLVPVTVLLVKGTQKENSEFFAEYWHYNIQSEKIEKKIKAGRH